MSRCSRGLDGIAFRAATEADLPECARLHRVAIDAYTMPMGFPPSPTENPGLERLHAHTLATDPHLFQVAECRGRPGRPGRPSVIAFGSAVERGPFWFLSMLFVDPTEQARGLGRALLERLLPEDRAGRLLATCTDSAQPISNGLYATFGMVPRMPFLNLLGRPRPGWTPPPLPGGVMASRAEPGSDGRLAPEDQRALDALDRELLAFTHPQDHAYDLRERPWLFRYRDGSGRLVGYGYTSEVGRIGPIGVADPGLLWPVVAHLLTTVEPRGASSIWLGGHASEAVAEAVRAGLRLEGFPILACWNEPYADFTRYVPTSPGLI
ncbi:MAG TPA: GNAT family N-acetyltransferase [Candidatus Binatia bacterium]|nr:GNAT family N-acetyltransferase [Candidatus Binatia bacterium]